jgi:glyoxylase-like metal-dependent hydrolase (beta-lactamase superfamily II)
MNLGIVRIPVPTPFPVGPVNVYLIPGKPVTLIEAGPLTDEAWRTLGEAVEERGHRLDQVEQVVITHPHQDHCGQAARVAGAGGAGIVAHRLTRDYFEDYEEYWRNRAADFTPLMLRMGVPPEVRAVAGRASRWASKFGTGARIARYVDEGEIIRTGAGDFAVLYTPGHARAAICLHRPQDGLLISGDTLLKEISSNALIEENGQGNGGYHSLATYLGTLRRLAAMEFSVILPGHGQEITDHQGLIRSRLAFHEVRKDTILTEMGERENTPFEVCRKLFPDLPAAALFLGLSEVFGHLEVLEDEGRVVRREDGPTVGFKRVLRG